MPVQEAVSIILPEIWLRKTPAVTFAKSNLPEKRHRIFQTEEEIRNLPKGSTFLSGIY